MGIPQGLAPFTLDDLTLGNQELVVGTGDPALPESVFFASRQRRLKEEEPRQRLDPLLNRLRLHTWGNAQPALRAGSTSADLVPTVAGAAQPEANALRDLVQNGFVREILIAELLNPLTGAVPGRQRAKRQLLRLLAGDDPDRGAAESLFDPVTLTWLVRVHWREEDALRFDYSFTTFCKDPAENITPVEDISMFFGNLVPVYEGRPMVVHFNEPGTPLPTEAPTVKHRYYQRLNRFGENGDWVLAELPDEGPLAYLPTPVDGEVPARSTLHVKIEPPGAPRDPWDEVESLVGSGDLSENGDHYMVETDEHQRSVLRFGNGTNGRLLPAGAVVHAEYQIGGGVRGNVGADQLTHVQALTGALSGAIAAAWNPFDVTDGRDPEPAEKVRRNAPEAFRARQLRAVTLADYVKRAEEVTGVSRAVARSDALWDELRPRIADHLEAVRLIGEDLELRPPRYVALEIHIVVCADPAYWREDLRFVLEQEFSDKRTADGRRGFFHPDQWSFGQSLHRSAIEGRIHQVAGIEHVVRITMKRFNAPTPGVHNTEVLEMGFDEVVLLANDPDHLERGLIRFDVQGGRQ